MMTDVCLVQMPYGAIERPSLALGLLKTYLSAKNIRARTVYATLDFAEAIGLDVYLTIEDTPAESLIGEWTFAGAAFREARTDISAFYDLVGARAARGSWVGTLKQLHPGVDLRALLLAVRERAPAFVDGIARKVLATAPRIVACTSTFQQHCAALALLRRVKELAPDVVTMLGGANCEGAMGELAHREFPWVDFVASGEVDGFFGDLCRSILEQGMDLDPRGLPVGVLAPRSRKRRRLAGEAPRAQLESLDQAAIPDYSDYFEALAASSLSDHVKPSLPFESSRGCWWGMKHHCTFCGLNGQTMTFRSKAVSRVVEEISTLQERYNVHYLQATDNIMDNRHMTTLLPELAARPDPPHLFYEVKANLKREQLRSLSAAGVRRIQPGVENLHDDVLTLIDKGTNLFINLQLLKWAQEYGVNVGWNFLCGAPGEKDEWYTEMTEWLPLLSHLEPPAGTLIQIRYDRFSVYFNDPQRFGLRLVPNRAYAHVYPLSEPALREVAYFFEDLDDAATPPGPGHKALARELKRWQAAFAGADGVAPARLLAEDLGDRVIVRDTRPVAVAAQIVLEGLDCLVWRHCDVAATVDGLARALAAPEAAIRDAVQRLADRRLVLEWRGRILALTVRAPVVPYLDPRNFWGYHDLVAMLGHSASRSLARRYIRLPGEMPLSELLGRA